MSVILTKMNMPKSCENCHLNYDCYKCLFTGEGTLTGFEEKRQEECPLKSIKGLIYEIERIEGNEDKSVYKNLHPSYVQGLKDAIKIIKKYCEMEY